MSCQVLCFDYGCVDYMQRLLLEFFHLSWFPREGIAIREVQPWFRRGSFWLARQDPLLPVSASGGPIFTMPHNVSFFQVKAKSRYLTAGKPTSNNFCKIGIGLFSAWVDFVPMFSIAAAASAQLLLRRARSSGICSCQRPKTSTNARAESPPEVVVPVGGNRRLWFIYLRCWLWHSNATLLFFSRLVKSRTGTAQLKNATTSFVECIALPSDLQLKCNNNSILGTNNRDHSFAFLVSADRCELLVVPEKITRLQCLNWLATTTIRRFFANGWQSLIS